MIRLKHIFIPLVAIATMTAYFVYAHQQAEKFNPTKWAHNEDNYRLENTGLLMAWVLKTGMTKEEVKRLAMYPEEGRQTLCVFGGPQPLVWSVDYYRLDNSKSFIVEYDFNDRVIDFYVEGERRPMIF